MPLGDALYTGSLLLRMYLKLFGIPYIYARITAPRVMKMLQPRVEDKILDMGCGFGLYSITLSKKSDCVVGVDLDSSDLELARVFGRGASAHFILADATRLPLRDDIFDKVVCLDVIEHVKDDVRLLREASRVLGDHGTTILTAPAIERTAGEDPVRERTLGHVRSGYSPSDLDSLFRKADLRRTESEDYFKHFSVLAWRGSSFFWTRLGTLHLAELYQSLLRNLPLSFALALTFPLLLLFSKFDTCLYWIKGNEIVAKGEKVPNQDRNERSYASIVVPTMNEEKYIRLLLESLKNQRYACPEVIIVDGGSKDNTVDIAKRYDARVTTFMGCEEFLSRNIGANIAKGEVLLFTCADVMLSKDLIKKIHERFTNDGHLVALSGPGIPYGAPLKGKFLYATYNLVRYLCAKLPKRLRCFSTSTNFLAVRKEVFQKTGGFDPVDINADGLMGRKLLQMGDIDFSLDSYVFISARRMRKMGFLRFCSHYLYVLENFFPSLSHIRLIKRLKERSRSAHRRLDE